MKRPGALASALRSSGSSVAASPTEEAAPEAAPVLRQQPPSRAGTKALTVHMPEQVRRQLKAMAGEQGRDVADMVAEALNLLFATYRRPEIAPRKPIK